MYFDKISINDQDIYCKDTDARSSINSVNSQINNINGRINNMDSQINNLNSEINNVNEKITRKFLLFGDSLMDGYTPDSDIRHGWGYWVKKYLESKGYVAYIATDIKTSSYGSAFAGNKTYLDHLNYTLKTNPSISNEYITDIVVYTGTNDISHTTNEMLTGIANFVNKVKEIWPFSSIKIGWFGYRHSITHLNTLQSCGQFGCSYIHGSEYLGLLNKYISTDNTHLSETGYEHYSPYLCMGVLDGNISYSESSGDISYSAGGINKQNTAINFTVTDEGVYCSLVNVGSDVGYGVANISGNNPGTIQLTINIPINTELVDAKVFQTVSGYIEGSPSTPVIVNLIMHKNKMEMTFIGPSGRIIYGPVWGPSYNKIF